MKFRVYLDINIDIADGDWYAYLSDAFGDETVALDAMSYDLVEGSALAAMGGSPYVVKKEEA